MYNVLQYVVIICCFVGTMAVASMDDLFSMDLNPDATPTPTQTTPTERSGATPTKSPIKRLSNLNDTNNDLLDLVKLETEGDCPTLYLLVHSHSDLYYLQATDGCQAWVGAISHQHIKETAKNAKGSEEAFLRDTELALTEAPSGYLYTTVLKPSDNSLEFSWKKHLVKEDIKVFLGSVVMETHATSALHLKMLDFAVSKMSDQHKTLHSLQLEKNRLIREREMTLKQLEETINLKDEVRINTCSEYIDPSVPCHVSIFYLCVNSLLLSVHFYRSKETCMGNLNLY